MATRSQRTSLSKKDLQAIADANGVEYTDKTTNPELEDALDAKGVDLKSAEESSDPTSATAGDGEDMTLVKSPTSQSGTAPATGTTAHASDADPEDSSGTPEALGSDKVLADDDLSDIDTGKLMGVKAIIDRVLEARGAPATAQTPRTVLELAKDLPVLAGEYDMSLAQAAKKVGVDENDALGFHIRQFADQHTNTPYGDRYLVVVDNVGAKHAVKL